MRLLDRRLGDLDLLEAARQRAIALEVALVVVVRRRADAAQLAGRQRGLEDVRRVQRAAARRAGADDGVDLVDEEDRARLLARAPRARPSGAPRSRRGSACRRAARPCRARRPSRRAAPPGPCPGGSAAPSPSASAVLPTPGSPTNTGLFLRRRQSTRTVRSSSCSRPISGSILPSRGARDEIDREAPERVLARPLGLVLVVLGFVGSASLSRRCRSLGDLRDAVRDVADHVEPRDALLLEQVRGVANRARGRSRPGRCGRGSRPCPPTARAPRRAGSRAGSRSSAAASSSTPSGSVSSFSSKIASRATRFSAATSPPHWRRISATSRVVQQRVEQVLDAQELVAPAARLVHRERQRRLFADSRLIRMGSVASSMLQRSGNSCARASASHLRDLRVSATSYGVDAGDADALACARAA